MTVRGTLGRLLPGVGLLVLVGLVARWLAGVVGVNHLVVAIALGILVANTVGVPGWAEAGLGTQTLWLETGIVLMGSRLSIDAVLGSGPRIVGLVIATILFTGLLVELCTRRLFGFEEKLGSLLAAGSSICGVSAIIAVSGSIRANEDQIAYAVATVLLFDAVTVFAYPLVGGLLDLPAQVYGVWAGLSMYSTGPVVAAGFAHSDAAGQWATVTKITRNLFIAVVAVGYSVLYARPGGDDADASLSYLWSTFPKFLVGFLGVVILANVGVFSEPQLASLENAYRWLFLVAFAGLGLSITTDDLRDAGPRPVGVMGAVLLVVSTVSLAVVSVLFAAA